VEQIHAPLPSLNENTGILVNTCACSLQREMGPQLSGVLELIWGKVQISNHFYYRLS
jgi:hypothetical protein